MPKFLFVYRSETSCQDKSPEDMQKIMQVWMDWIEGGTKAGWLVSGGHGLMPQGAMVRPDLTVTDGPFAESKELVGGYSMVQAADLAAACEIAKTTPVIADGCTVEVRPLMEMEDCPEPA